MAAEKLVVDWKAIEVDFRAGVKSLEQIGKEQGVTKGRISQVAKRDQWTRDLNKRIKARADAKVNEAALNADLNAKTDRLAERDVVDANAEVQYRIRMAHRTDIGRARKIFGKLMAEVELTTDNQDLFERLGEFMDISTEDSDGKGRVDKANEIYRRVISMGGRIDSAKKLIEMLEKVVKMEREAFGIDSAEQSANSVDALLAKINASAD